MSVEQLFCMLLGFVKLECTLHSIRREKVILPDCAVIKNSGKWQLSWFGGGNLKVWLACKKRSLLETLRLVWTGMEHWELEGMWPFEKGLLRKLLGDKRKINCAVRVKKGWLGQLRVRWMAWWILALKGHLDFVNVWLTKEDWERTGVKNSTTYSTMLASYLPSTNPLCCSIHVTLLARTHQGLLTQ